MGDRCVFGFRETSTRKAETVWLYSHWGGHGRELDLANALEKAEPRWSDPSYATRIAISQLVGENWNQEYSYGIFVGQTYRGDNEYPTLLVVNWDERQVTAESESGEVISTFGFDTFIYIAKKDAGLVGTGEALS